MTIKYAIFNPSNGSYTYKDTYEDACSELASVGYEFYKSQTHGNPCTYIEVQDDGSEIWRNADGVILPSPEDIRKEMEKQALIMTKRIYSDLPTTTL
jgi:hypothetical protein